MKSIQLNGSDLTEERRMSDAISEMIIEALADKGITVASFAWCIDVDYDEEKTA